MKKPKISLIMPVYNAEKFLDESILSVLNQTFKDFEFIMIEDCSTDDSLKILKKYFKKDKRIILKKNNKNLGVVDSRNKGLKIAKGKYIAVLDADDICLKKRFELQYNFMEKNKEIFLCGSSAIVIDEVGRKIGIFKKENNPKKIKKKLLKGNPIVHSSIMYRNDFGFFYRKKFDDAYEYDLYLRILSAGKKITNMPNFLIKFRLNQNSTSFQKKFEREFFPKKIKEFYFQRKNFGKDDYENFDTTKILNQKKMRDPSQDLLQARIIAGFQAGHAGQIRKDIKNLIKKKGLNKSLALYYLLSFFPIKFVWFAKRKIF